MSFKGHTSTVEEKRWMDISCQMGCCVCLKHLGIPDSPAMPHHIEGKTKKGSDLLTIPLCHNHHTAELESNICVSLHKNKPEFIRRYGSEHELLEWCRERLAWAEAA